MLAMIICDSVIEDVESGKKSLIGLFDHVQTTDFPSVVNELNVFLSLTDGRGNPSAELRCVDAQTEEVLFRTTGEIEFPDPLTVVDLHFRFQGCEFPEAGEYRFQFLCNNELLRERKFYVERENEYDEEEDQEYDEEEADEDDDEDDEEDEEDEED